MNKHYCGHCNEYLGELATVVQGNLILKCPECEGLNHIQLTPTSVIYVARVQRSGEDCPTS